MMLLESLNNALRANARVYVTVTYPRVVQTLQANESVKQIDQGSMNGFKQLGCL